MRAGRTCVTVATAVAMLLTGCGDDGGRDVAIDRVVHVPAPDGAELGEEPDHGGLQAGDPVVVDDCCAVFVYEPDQEHPDGWLGNGDTVAVRYVDAGVFDDVGAACTAFTEWASSYGATTSPDCADVANAARSASAEAASFDLGGISTDEFESVELGASLLVRDGDVSAVFRIVATG